MERVIKWFLGMFSFFDTGVTRSLHLLKGGIYNTVMKTSRQL